MPKEAASGLRGTRFDQLNEWYHLLRMRTLRIEGRMGNQEVVGGSSEFDMSLKYTSRDVR